ncbi:glycosyltransferase [Microbacterium kunmingense]|uniref:glycosyltransferase n=1 Tax=Microbacterium kunmingense TaxID=2915939 RepID=UPI002004DD52|nr:glycosyltransferase [Microbacterium kunmingense]
MNTTTRVSVCMASYNGSRFIVDQLRSILDELEVEDEVIVVDDASSDDTVSLVEGIEDDRVRLIRGAQNVGYVRAFERAMEAARGDVIFLADQDDVWVSGRRAVLLGALDDADLAASNLRLLHSGDPLPSPITRRPWMLSASSSARWTWNRLRILLGIAPYYGCAMAMTRSFSDLARPFPRFLTESHDLWLAILANTQHSVRHVETATLLRRIHDSNSSPSRPRGVAPALRSRIMLIRAVLEARRRVRAHPAM